MEEVASSILAGSTTLQLCVIYLFKPCFADAGPSLDELKFTVHSCNVVHQLLPLEYVESRVVCKKSGVGTRYLQCQCVSNAVPGTEYY